MVGLNDPVAKPLGISLRNEREASGRTLDEIAHALCLWRSQVAALEEANTRAFYTPHFFALAAKKYCALLNLNYPSDLLATEEKTNSHTTQSLLNGFVRDAIVRFQNKKQSSRVAIIAALIISVLLAAVFSHISKPENVVLQSAITIASTNSDVYPVSESKIPKQIVMEPNDVPRLEVPEVSAKSVIEPLPATERLEDVEIELNFTDSTWCHVVYKSGQAQSFRKRAGDKLRLVKSDLQALIIGDMKSLELRGANGLVDLSKFYDADKRQVRILGADARGL